MQRSDRITAIVLTYNEELHIERCLRSVMPFCEDVLVVDSYSTDHTLEIAERLGARTVQHPFENQARQFNWALRACEIKGQWIWRVDADEYISEELGRKVKSAIATCADDVNGIYVNKRIVFMGRPLKHGGWYPAPQIKVIRRGFGCSEDKIMDEHLIVMSGKTIRIDGDQTDENLNNLTWWTAKHNGYAMREAENMLLMRYGMDKDASTVDARLFGNDAERKRRLKICYSKMPLFIRPFLYFFVRYILKGGFLDGREGFVWHILQGFWYRMLVDAKIFELKKRFGFDDARLRDYIKQVGTAQPF